MSPRTRIMIVDDSEQLRHALETLIGANDTFEVVATARDGEEAVARAKEHRPDVILMDIRMPVMNGVEATRRILSDMSGVSVVAHTAYDDAELVADMVKAGARGYLVKGATADELFDGLSSAVQGEARISDSATRGLFEELGSGRQGASGGEVEALAARLADQRRTDGLTGVLRRSELQIEIEDAVGDALETRSPMALLVLRVVDLQYVNAKWGWQAGDSLLCSVATTASAGVGAAGVLGRVDGDEFAVVLPGHDGFAARRLAEELLVRCGGDRFADFEVSVAVGLAAIEWSSVRRVEADSLMAAARAAAGVARAGEIRGAEVVEGQEDDMSPVHGSSHVGAVGPGRASGPAAM